jgi:hypothetical protein
MSATARGSAIRRRDWIPALAFAALVVILYADPLFFRRNFAGRDLFVYNLPMEKAMHDAYARGRLPVWMPEMSGGRPLMPNPNAGAMYPLRPLLSVLPFPAAMRLFPSLHWIAAGIGVIVLLRSLGTSRAGAWLGAVTYVFSGVGVAEVFFPHIHPGMALLPWVVWAVARPTGSASRKVLLLSLLYALLFLAGDVFTVGMAVLASGLWILLEMERRDRRRELGLVAAALGLAGLLAAPQIVATMLWIPETNRAVLGMRLQETFFFSIHPFRLLELVVPFPFGPTWDLDITRIWGWSVFRNKAMGIFTTLYAGAFALVALPAAWRLRTPGARFGRILLLLSLVLAVPPSLVRVDSRLGLLHSPLPLRNPEKFAVAIVFALAILSALALDRLRQTARRPRWPLAVAALLTALAAGAALFPEEAGRLAVGAIGGSPSRVAIASGALPAAFAEGGLLWAATVIALDLLRRPSRRAMACSLVLLTAVPIVAGRRIARTHTEAEVFAPTPFARRLQRADPEGAFRTLGESLYRPASREPFADSAVDPVYPEPIRRIWIQPVNVLWGRGTVFNNDFDAGDLARLQALRRLAPAVVKFDNAATLLGSLALRWGIRYRDQEPLPGYTRGGGDWLQDWDENAAALPDVRLARGIVEEAGALPAVSRLSQLQPGDIVVETGRQWRTSARPGTVRVSERSAERLLLTVNAPDSTYLFVLRGFWSHRTVRLDGRPVEPVPAQLAFTAIPIPAGEHVVDWRENLPGGGMSRLGPVLFVLAAAALLLRERRRAAIRSQA